MSRKVLLITILSLVSSMVFPKLTLAEDLLPYFNPNASCTNSISNGEQFTNKTSGSGFIIQKSADPAYYERFGYDNQYIYHYEDTTWATGNNQNVKCNGTNDDATLVLFRGSFGSSQNVAAEAANHSADLGMIWIKRDMSPGECFTSDATAVGKNKRTGQYCDTPYSGPGAGHTLCMAEKGPLCLSTGYNMKNGIALTVQGGAGTGEQYYYDKSAGWVGFGENLATSSTCGGKESVGSCKIVTPPPPPKGGTTGSGGTTGRCKGEYLGPLRPNAYSVCKLSSIPDPDTIDVETFDVTATVTMDIDKILASPICDNKYFPVIDWYTKVLQDYSKTKLPMAGWGYSPTLKEINGKVARPESSYLADYLEGTAYYTEDGNRPTFNGTLNNTRNSAGVFRKLAPSWYEDYLKCEMIKNVKAGKQEDYEIKVNLTSGDQNFIESLLSNLAGPWASFLGLNKKKLSEFDSCPPSDPEKRRLWNLSHPRQALLWEFVPMFTREDTPGKLTLSPQNPPGSLTDATGGNGTKQGSSVVYPLSVPHVARLYAVSQTTGNMLLPSALQNTTTLAEAPNSPIIASSTRQTAQLSAGPAANLFAEANCEQPFTLTVDNVSYQNGKVYYSVELDDPNTDGVQCHLYINDKFWGGCVTDKEKGNPTRLDAGNSSGLLEPISAGPDGTFTINVTAQMDNHKPCGFTAVIGSSCNVTIKAGKIDASKTTCGPPAAIAPTPTPCGFKGNLKRPTPPSQAKIDPKDPKYLDNMTKNAVKQNLVSKGAMTDGGIPVQEVQNKKIKCDLCQAKKELFPATNCDPDCTMSVSYTTGVSSSLSLPYLKTIWKQEARDKKSGLFNIFTPGSAANGFIKVDSKSVVPYGVEGNYPTTYYTQGSPIPLPVDSITINPPQGNVLFPYLQGIYDAQTCVSQSLLLPGSFAKPATCPRLY